MNEKTSTSGVGFVGFLTLLFIALKLLRVISWPWIWVLSPIWISVGLFVLLAGIILIVTIAFSK